MNKLILLISILFLNLYLIPFYDSLSVNIPSSVSSTVVITNLSSNSSDLWITDEGIMDNVVDILGSEITNDLGWAVGGGDTWTGNYTFYYNKTQVDNNFSLYYLLSNPYVYLNATTISNSTIVRLGNYNCTGSNVVQNVTINSSGIFSQCVAQTAGADSWAGNYTDYYNKTEIDTNFSLYTLITNLVSYVGNWTLDKINYYNKTDIENQIINNQSYFSTYNATYAANMANNSWNESLAHQLFDTTFNATYNALLNQNCPAGQVVNGTYPNGTFLCVTLTVVETEPSWNSNYTIFTGLINNASYLSTFNTTYDTYVTLNKTNYSYFTNYSYYGNWVNDNASWNQSMAYNLYLNRTSEALYLSTYNETYANNLDTNDSQTIADSNASWLSTYNESYATWLSNYSIFEGLINNASYLSTFNQSYDDFLNSNSTIARIGDCAEGQVVMNITTGGVECVTPTVVESDPAWNSNYTIFTGLINNASYLSTYNETYHNYVVANYSNVSNYWDNLSSYNSTQMDSTGGVLNILVSWLTSLFYTESEIDSKIINNQSYFSTYNATYESGSNSSWNQSFANSLYLNRTSEAIYLSTANATYDTCINNASYLSTYNVTYHNYVYGNISNFSYYWNGLFGLTNNWLFNNGTGYLSFNDTKLNTTISQEGVRLGFNSTYNSSYDAFLNSNSTIVRKGNYNCTGITVLQNYTINTSGAFGQCVTPTAVEIEPSWNGNYTIFTGLIGNASYLSTYNTTYATTTIEWDGNKSALIGCINNASYLSTYNTTYSSYNSTGLIVNDTLNTYTNWNAIWINTSNATYNNLLSQNCPSGKVVNGTYPNGTFYCTTPTGSSFNQTYHDYVIANYTNVSNYWDNLSTYNSTQMDSTGGTLNIIVSWLTSLFYTKAETNTTISQEGVRLGFNNTYNTTYAGYNSTGLILNHSLNTYNTWNTIWSSTSNATYAGYNSTGLIVNHTNLTYGTWNTIWNSTYNATYAGFNSTGLIVNHTTSAVNLVNQNVSIVKNNTSPTFVNVTLGGVLYYETAGACILDLNHSHCKNTTGQYIIGIIIPLLRGLI